MPSKRESQDVAQNKTGGSIKIIQEIVLKCAFCHGDRYIGAGLCSVCKGKGENHVHPPLITCRRCGGWGSYPQGSQNVCITCRGVGANPVTLPIHICSNCEGRGDLASGLSCTPCRGKGVV